MARAAPADPAGPDRAAALARERAFFDAHYADDAIRGAQGKYYQALARCRARYFEIVRREAAGKRLLDYCCGAGATAFELGGATAETVGIDISAEAVRQASARAAREGHGHMRFLEGDAHATGLPDASFDVVASTGVIHHLDVERAWREIHRLLKPGGVGVFVEALGHNPAIELYRRLTPLARSPDEHPLKRRDFRVAERLFAQVEYEFHALTAIAAVFAPMGVRAAALQAMRKLDDILLSVPGLRWQAWAALVVLRK